MIPYYERHAQEFFDRTVALDLAPLRAPFLARLSAQARILDAGCGSGRDSRVFLGLGFDVTSIDASPQLAALATAFLGRPVTILDIEAIAEVAAYDGIWASASLLHIPRARLPAALARLTRALRPGGTLYCSFKEGLGERDEGLRRFTDQTVATLTELLRAIPGLEPVQVWATESLRPGHDQPWINALAARV